VVLITGGTDGLGRVAALKLLQANDIVVITGRSESKLNSTIAWLRQQTECGTLHTLMLDLASLDSVRQAAESFKQLNLELDVLINNAATITSEREYVSDTKTVEKTVFVNAVAPWYFTQLMLPLVKQRILFVTSSLHDPNVRGGQRSPEEAVPTDLRLQFLDGRAAWHSMQFYKVSKVAQLWLAAVLHQQHPEKVIAFCPGFVPTTSLNRNASWVLRLIMYYVISRMSFATSEDQAASDYVYYAHEASLLDGFYY
ncbi:hypothetical protein BJV82DRAFT_494319, partial [Fennellomyces sp. T-0311]